jgi:peptidoglycan/LPS O-acetylase OafA/YrhL
LPAAALPAPATHPQLAPSQTEQYSIEIDGLRALAVLAVLFCHAKLALFAGGYVGVDVFFVISGYVVSASILRRQQQGSFALGEFYARRLKRLLPSLYAVLAATLAFGLLFCFPEDNANLLKNIGAVALFYSNIYLSRQTGYFDLGADQQPLMHTWSLSVEEQFYLLFPLLLVLLARRAGGVKLAVAGLLCAASLACSQYAVNHALAGAYFQLHTRAFEFLIGMLLALVCAAAPRPRWSPWYELMLALGLAAIGYAVLRFQADTPMPGLHALLPCLGAALVIAGARGGRYLNHLLANPLAGYLGRISYVLYLWHWPVLYALRRLGQQSGGAMLAGLALSAALAVLTHHLLEQPLRRLSWGKGKTIALLFGLPVVVLGLLVAGAARTDNYAGLYPQQRRLDYLHSGHTVFMGERARRCWSKVDLTRAADCSVGAAGAATKAVFLGDSHGYQLIDFIDQLGKDHQLSIHDLTYTMCAPLADSPAKAGSPGFQAQTEACREHNRQVTQYLLARPDIGIVILSAIWHLYANEAAGAAPAPTLHGFLPGELDRRLDQTITALEAAGKRVVLFDDVPTLPAGLENCTANKLYLPGRGGADCSYPQAYADHNHRAALAILAGVRQRHPHASFVHTYDLPCAGGRCQAELRGVPLYSHNDGGHLGAGGSAVYYAAYLARRPDELAAIFAPARTATGLAKH